MSESWTFSKVFRLMHERSNSGLLEVLTPDGEILIHLAGGTVVNVEGSVGVEWPLGNFLVDSELVSPNELLRAHRRAQKADQSIEDTLVSRKLISKDTLRRFVELHVREVVLPLFRREGITCRFVDKQAQPNPWLTPIPMPFFLKTAAKRAKDWPRLHQRIPYDDMVFDKVDVYIETVLQEASAIQPSPRPGSEPVDHITGNERLAYYHLNGKKTVRQLGFAACLGEYETRVALCRLQDRGYIETKEEHGAGERLRKKRVILPAVGRVLAYALTAAIVVGLIVLKPGALREPSQFLSWMPEELEQEQRAHHLSRVGAALEGAFLAGEEAGQYPRYLDELVAAGWLEAFELQGPLWDDSMRYVPLSEPPNGFQLKRGE